MFRVATALLGNALKHAASECSFHARHPKELEADIQHSVKHSFIYSRTMGTLSYKSQDLPFFFLRYSLNSKICTALFTGKVDKMRLAAFIGITVGTGREEHADLNLGSVKLPQCP